MGRGRVATHPPDKLPLGHSLRLTSLITAITLNPNVTLAQVCWQWTRQPFAPLQVDGGERLALAEREPSGSALTFLDVSATS